MAEFGVTHTPKSFRTYMESFRGRLAPEIYNALSDVGNAMEATLVKERLSSPETGKPWLATRSGDLKRSTRQREVTGDRLGNIKLRMWIDVPYARVQEFGTVGAGGELPDITPKKASWLTIPLDAAKFPTGLARGSAREVGDEYESTFFERTETAKGTQLILYGVSGEEVTPLFLLVKRVAIPPRLGYFATWKKLAPFRRKRLVKAVKDASEKK